MRIEVLETVSDASGGVCGRCGVCGGEARWGVGELEYRLVGRAGWRLS